jgi:DNA-binding CsgD family transcriptional regulator
MTDWLDIPVGELPRVIQKTDRGLCHVTNRELQVIQCLAKGMTAKQAAVVLGLSPRTMEIHSRNIKARTGLNTTAQLIIAFDRLFREHPCDYQDQKLPKPDAMPGRSPAPRSKSARRWSRFLSR